MSGAFDKRTDGAGRRQARVDKESQEKRKVRIIAVSVIAVLALLFAGALFVNSKLIRRTLPAITIGGYSFTAVEFEYFYNSAFHEYREMIQNQMPDLAYMLPQNKPFTGQINPMTGESWSDTFIEYAVESMTELVQYYNAANAAGYVLSSEQRSEIDSEIEAFMSEAMMYGFPSLDALLQQIYGSNINEDSFRKIVEFIYFANAYSQHVRDSFSYDARRLADHYFENRDTFDTFTYRYILVTAETLEREDFETEDEYDDAVEAALAEAREKAEEIESLIITEDDFIAAALEYDEEQFSDPYSTLRTYPGSWLGGFYGPWMREAERVYGDVTTVEATTGVYVVFYIDRDPNEYRMTDVRQILLRRDVIEPENYPDGEDDPEYHEAVERVDAELRARAEHVLAIFEAGGATEALLIEMMEEFSEDWTEGGLYTDISKDPSQNKMPREIEAWLFDPARKIGDYDIVSTEDVGYHLLFFVDHGERLCDFVAGKQLRDNDFRDWKDNLEPVEVVRRWAFVLAQL